MKLIRQTTLYYREGSSDKVYEVDLCEVSPGRYLVNFRYGRRGTNLKEGSKTTSAVALTQAQRLFAELVSEKVKKGYSEQTPTTSVTPPQPIPKVKIDNTPSSSDPRNQKILDHLSNFLSSRSNKTKHKWPIERVIWRAGELKIREATPLLINLISNSNSLRDYCIAWALGWCADESAVSALGRLYGDSRNSDSVRRIAAEALLKLSDEETQKEFRQDMIERLPLELRDSARNGSAEKFTQLLKNYLKNATPAQFEILDTIYLIDNKNVRPALLEILRTATLKPNYFKHFRHIFKAAEYRLDAEVFGLIAYRFEKEKEMFQANSYSNTYYITIDGRVTAVNKKALKTPDSPIAYSNHTRMYLRKRVWRTLRRMGNLNNYDYVKMAVGVLLPYTDQDALPTRQTSYYNWQTRNYTYTNYDKYASYISFNYILYGNSTRYVVSPGHNNWRCRPTYKPADPAPKIREESFPKLWENVPVGLLHLLVESNCEEVHNFATKAIESCSEFCDELDIEVLMLLLTRPYQVTAELAFNIVKARYDRNNPNGQLLLALANSSFAPARSQAYRWIDESRHHFTKDINFIFSLITSQQVETRNFSRNFLNSVIFADSVAKELISQVIAYLLSLRVDTNNLNLSIEIKEITDIVSSKFTYALASLELNIILKLLDHPILEIQEFGGKILLNHQIKSVSLQEDIIYSLMNSTYESMRAIGINLLGQLPNESLLAKESLLLSLCTHTLADIRSTIRPIIGRLASANREFGQKLGLTLIDKLLVDEPFAKLHSYIVSLLSSELKFILQTLDWELTLKLTKSKSPSAQEMAGVLLQANSHWASHYTTDDLVKLSNSELQAVRVAAQELFKNSLPRFYNDPNEMAISIRFLDCKWDEERKTWFKIFQDSFTSEHLSPVILVSICDSTREDVQKFGRDLILKYFSSESGPEYLMKLSEHPSHTMKMFVTNYLEEYAANNADRLKELTPYFISTLSAINKARIAKERVLNFLAKEAEKDVKAAEVVAEILTRQSVTMAIRDKAHSIESMLKIHSIYPQIALPIQVKALEVRRGI